MLIFALIVMVIPVTSVEAKSKVKLSATKLTITVGKTANLVLRNCAEKKTWSSSNKKLEKLNCERNPLTSIKISNCPKLKSLICGKSNPAALDLNNCKGLEFLDVQQCKLTSLDVTRNTRLFMLECWKNKIKTIDISKCSKIVTCACDNFVEVIGEVHSFLIKELEF